VGTPETGPSVREIDGTPIPDDLVKTALDGLTSAARGSDPRPGPTTRFMLLETVADTAPATPDGRWREVPFDVAGPLVRLGTPC